jgi:glucokinase-like ROK family protein
MARFAAAAVAGGAAAIRACGVEDVRAIRSAVKVPIIGIEKIVQDDGRILITPSFEGARALIDAGADAIALDCTERGQRYGALTRMQRIREELQVPVLADISTVTEAEAAARAGASAVLTTLRGYTGNTAHVTRFDPEFVAELCRRLRIPVIAEGRIGSPEGARAAVRAGAWCVIVGTAITRPSEITRRFARAAGAVPAASAVAAVDLGGTNTKIGVVSNDGQLAREHTIPTPSGGRDVLLRHLRIAAARCLREAERSGTPAAALGIATAGWVDPESGRVAYATENLPGWTGTEIARTLHEALGVPVAVENDANALALAEQHFGAGRGVRHFVCLTLGTGVGGGCCINGELNRGAHFFANALGHITVEPDGLPCTCGQRGCLEQYASAAALLRYAGPNRFDTAEQVIAAANKGEATAYAAVREFARYLARGCATVLHVLDPELLVLSGGLAQNNSHLIEAVREELAAGTTMWEQRKLRVEISTLGYYGGVLGAAAIARQLLLRQRT